MKSTTVIRAKGLGRGEDECHSKQGKRRTQCYKKSQTKKRRKKGGVNGGTNGKMKGVGEKNPLQE